MHEVYEKTSLTPMRAARLTGYIDWASQPSRFKRYPEFLFRYPFASVSALRIAELSRIITSRSMIAGKPYVRLSPPSAGNLHPVELYVQIRGIKGVLSGIYHVNAEEEALVLIREIERDGIEPEVGVSERFDGMLFVLSCVPYRAEWNDGERAVRYCFLDAGHQIGAVQAAAAVLGQDATYLSDFDPARLDTVMGFGAQEFSCAVLSLGNPGTKTAEPISQPLMQVAPTDYCESRGYVPLHVARSREKADAFALAPMQDVTETTILERRSARKFGGAPLPATAFEYFMHWLGRPPEPLQCHTVVLNAEGVPPGVYTASGLTRPGEFAETMARLLVDQNFVKAAAMVIVFSAETFDPGALMAAGAFAQKIALDAEQRNLGFTGIGAFYDAKLQRFLPTEHYILYVCAIGTKGTQDES